MGFSEKSAQWFFRKRKLKKEDLFCVILKVPMLPGLRNNGSESDRSHSELKLIYSRNAKRKILFIRFGRGDLKFSMAGQFIFFQDVFIFQLRKYLSSKKN